MTLFKLTWRECRELEHLLKHSRDVTTYDAFKPYCGLIVRNPPSRSHHG